MVCQHCGKVVDNDLLTYCVYCGYPMKGSKKGFFSKQEQDAPPAPQPQQTAPAPQPAPAPAPAQAANQMQNQTVYPQQNAAPVQNPVQPGAPQPNMTAQMPNQMQNQMPGQMQNQMPGQMQNPMAGAMPQMMQGAAQMPGPMMQGMPQMGYGMPQMGYGMPQFAGYDTNGNPVYFQTVQQFMGYDAYGNPLYSMVNIPYMPQMQMPGVMPGMPGVQGMPGVMQGMPGMPAMPGMQGMPGMQPMPQAPMPLPVVDTNYVEVPEAQPVQAQPAPQPVPEPAPQPMPQPQPQPVQPAVQPQPVQQPVMQQEPPRATVQNAQDAIAQALQDVMQTAPANPYPSRQPMPAAPQAPGMPEPQGTPVQAMFPMPGTNQETAYTDPKSYMAGEEPHVSGSVQIESQEDVPFNADAVMNEEPSSAPPVDEEALLDSIFGDGPKTYTMSTGAKPAAATFSIKVGTDEIISIRDEEAPPPQPEAKPRKAAASKPEKAPKPEKPVKAEKEAKADARKGGKKQQTKKAPATIVSPEDFFDDMPRRQTGMMSTVDLDNLTDEQLEARLAASNPGNKKSRRSMKSAIDDDPDLSNLPNAPGRLPQ
jgi:hypothetical protein